MKLLARLEKKPTTWLLILVCVVFALLRLPSLIEPYWYGDEGIYEVVGQAMSHRRGLSVGGTDRTASSGGLPW